MDLISRPKKSNTSAGEAEQAIGTGSKAQHPTFAAGPDSRQVQLTLQGEYRARAYLNRLQLQRVEVDDLAACVAMLSDAVSLAGFCRVIEKALGVRS